MVSTKTGPVSRAAQKGKEKIVLMIAAKPSRFFGVHVEPGQTVEIEEGEAKAFEGMGKLCKPKTEAAEAAAIWGKQREKEMKEKAQRAKRQSEAALGLTGEGLQALIDAAVSKAVAEATKGKAQA